MQPRDGDEAVAMLETSLTNQTPTAEQVSAIEAIREIAKDLGAEIIYTQKPSRERSLAITKLEECVMWAVKGIVLEGKKGDPAQPN